MKRLLCLAAVLLMLFPFAPARATNDDEYNPDRPGELKSSQIKGQSAIVIDAKSGEAIFEKNADTPMFPASTTKILTVLIALQNSAPEDMVTVNPSALMVPEDGSMIGLVAGETLTMDALIKATMVASGNDGANAIAEHIAGSQEAFVRLMNETAFQLGATSSHFNNAHGYHDENHYSTARDMAIITRAAMAIPEFREIAKLYSFVLPGVGPDGKERKKLYSHSRFLLNPDINEGKYYYPYAIGVKTGYHSQAGNCFVGAAEKGGIELISVTLKSGADSRWTDTKRLMEYAFSRYVTTSIEAIYKENPKTVDIAGYALDDPKIGQLELSLRKREPLADDQLVGFIDQATNWQRVFNNRTTVSLDRVLEAPISAGEVIGTMVYTPEAPGATPVEYDLIATRDVKRRPSAVPTVDEIIQYSNNDPNPFPRFSLEFAFLVAAPVISVIVISQLFYKLFTRKRKPKYKRHMGYKTRYYR